MSAEPASDEELIERARREPAFADDCFAELYRRYHPKVAAWCLRIAGDREEAADVAQEVFLRIHSRLGSFRGESRFSTWLYQVTRSVALNRAEYASRRKTDSLDEDEASEVIDPLAGIDASLEEAEIHARLRAAVESDLEPLEARVLILHFVHGLTLPRITQLLALANKSGAKAYIVSALRKLKAGFARGELWRTEPGRATP
ncbi:MAG TPA: sigma-70 family RNA polymerase sigma factor [Thermoanaerobaculia bacterium]|nr:sigma-70 family RNA polymerase sigma factor [Thermoanaerobaculia bacterium]